MVDTAFIYFRKSGGGHLAVISSIAGTKGLGVAPAYSATKRFQNTYIDALEQLSYLQKLNIRFTDIRPGFVATDLLNDGKHYPLLMDAAKVGRHIAWSPETTDSSDRLALPDTSLFLENDSPLDVETAARENQLTPKANQERNK